MKYKTSNNVLSIVHYSLIILASFASTQSNAQESHGVIKIISNHTVAETINNLETILLDKGMTIFTRVDHTAGAKKVGLQLRPTELLIFGNPKVGTPLMLCSQTTALDLPQKAMAYEDIDGQVWLTYNDPAYLAKRHDIQTCEKPLKKISHALDTFTRLATK